MAYYVYLVECSDNTYYCGYTKDVKRRVGEHNNSNKGAKYTSGRKPVTLKYYEEYENLSGALKREYEIKQLTREEKGKLSLK